MLFAPAPDIVAYAALAETALEGALARAWRGHVVPAVSASGVICPVTGWRIVTYVVAHPPDVAFDFTATMEYLTKATGAERMRAAELGVGHHPPPAKDGGS